MVIVLDKSVRSPCPPIVPLHEYVVPLMVIEAVFVAVDDTEYGRCRTRTAVTVDVLFADDVAVSVTVKVP